MKSPSPPWRYYSTQESWSMFEIALRLKFKISLKHNFHLYNLLYKTTTFIQLHQRIYESLLSISIAIDIEFQNQWILFAVKKLNDHLDLTSFHFFSISFIAPLLFLRLIYKTKLQNDTLKIELHSMRCIQ